MSDQDHLHWPPGYRRGEDGTWTDERGARVEDPATLGRLKALAIPPAWRDVWAARDPEERVQARGVDSRGRMQYRYSAKAVADAAQDKFAHMLYFAKTLPELRKRVDHDLRRRPPQVDLEQGTALAIRLLDKGLFRVGNPRYLQDNHTYGLTTLDRGQVEVRGRKIIFDYVGKEHIRHVREVEDASAARVMSKMLAAPGTAMDPVFVTGEEPSRRIGSATVNSYIHATTGSGPSAKTFRTWGATVIAAAVRGGAHFDSPKKHKDETLYAFEAAAHVLGNTPTMARTSYVHPRAIELDSSSEVRGAVTEAAQRLGSRNVEMLFTDEDLQETVRRALSGE